MTPSVFIINSDGVPLEMLYGNITTKELTGKINKAIEVGMAFWLVQNIAVMVVGTQKW